MSAPVLWIIAAAAMAIGETLTMGFFLAPFAVGAAAAAILAAIASAAVVPWIAFIAVSLLMLWIVRPIATAHRRTTPETRTGAAALVGRDAIVLERIANDEAVGCVRIDGEVWTARAYDEDHVIDAGARVQVMEIRGATALVSEL
jgi:membrane protein implicated in regulation of membrane protease activity